MHALTPEAPLTTARKERLNGLFFSIESDDQPVFLVSLPGLLQKASESLVTAPSSSSSGHFEIINAPLPEPSL